MKPIIKFNGDLKAQITINSDQIRAQIFEREATDLYRSLAESSVSIYCYGDDADESDLRAEVSMSGTREDSADGARRRASALNWAAALLDEMLDPSHCWRIARRDVLAQRRIQWDIDRAKRAAEAEQAEADRAKLRETVFDKLRSIDVKLSDKALGCWVDSVPRIQKAFDCKEIDFDRAHVCDDNTLSEHSLSIYYGSVITALKRAQLCERYSFGRGNRKRYRVKLLSKGLEFFGIKDEVEAIEANARKVWHDKLEAERKEWESESK
jgi:hypothetical protein